MSTEIETRLLTGEGFTGYACVPQNQFATAVIVVTGSDGGLTAAQYLAERFAREGIAALAVAYFAYPGLSATLELIPLEYIERAAQWLKANTKAEKIAIYGVSKGAEYALSAAIRYPLLHCVVAVVPHYCVTEGIGPAFGTGTSSWTYKGRPLPYLPLSKDMDAFQAVSAAEGQMSIKTLYELAEQAGVPDDAVIPVEKSAARILLLSSTLDNVWPSKHASEKIAERLRQHNFSYEYRHVNFETSSHVLNPVPPEIENLLAQSSRAEREHPQECADARAKAFDLAVEWIRA
jgi:dienelactone hydrolase